MQIQYAAQGVLGVFQKLVASRAHDAEGFRILGALLQHLPLDALQPYLPTVRAPWTLLPAAACRVVFHDNSLLQGAHALCACWCHAPWPPVACCDLP
jgi:hypothetical protein